MKKTRFTLLILCLTGAALRAEEVRFAEIKITGGDTLRDVVLLAAEPDGLRLQHRDGACRVKFERLPREVQEQFHYDPEAAVKYATARTKERAELDANYRRKK